MKIEHVKVWNCNGERAIAVNLYPVGSVNPENIHFESFNEWRLNPANQPVTDLDGIYNSEQVKIIDQYRHGHCNWTDCKPGDYQIPKVSYLFRKKLIAIPEAALCNTDSRPEVVENNYYYMVGETKIWCLEKTYLEIIRYEKARGIEPTCTGFEIIPTQPNKPQNSDSLHVGETVEEAAYSYVLTTEFATIESIGHGIEDSFIKGANWMKDKLSEANGEESEENGFKQGYEYAFKKLYTHEQVLAFGEKVKELAAEKVTTYSDDMGVWVDKDSILSIDLNKIEIK